MFVLAVKRDVGDTSRVSVINSRDPGALPAITPDPLRCPILSLCTKQRSEVDEKSILNRFKGVPMARQNFPDLANVSFQVQHESRWGIWLVMILGGVLSVFALTALIVSLLIGG